MKSSIGVRPLVGVIRFSGVLCQSDLSMFRRLLLRLFVLTVISVPLQLMPSAHAQEPIESACLLCHSNKQDGFSPAHAFAADNCVSCHAGNNTASTEDSAHEGLLDFPGELANAERGCGNCHHNRVASVANNLMHDGRGIVRVTRQLFDKDDGTDESINFQSLGHGIADSMLRKQCASCHIGQKKTEHRHDVMWDRGGGCLACHVGEYPENAHPTLTANVSDARCFGCHARSGRISLSFSGLAEVDPATGPGNSSGLRLPDDRHVEKMPADVHYLAGMSCIDCHTSVGLMGDAGDALHQRQAVDISCSDCHDNRSPTINLAEWPTDLVSVIARLPFAATTETDFLTTANNRTPLWHVELRDDGAWLHTKNTGRVLRIPTVAPASQTHDEHHGRLACASCHSQWAPQCFGCHMEYDPDGEQWDHVERATTPGRWSNKRWHVNNALPALGVNDDDRIELFVPGMVMTVDHPDLVEEQFVRIFAPLSPHTTGKSRSCESCHRSSEALGLGQGQITRNAGETLFEPANDLLRDGLPADAWTNVGNTLGGGTPMPGQRPLNKAEMDAVLDAFIPGEPGGNPADQ